MTLRSVVEAMCSCSAFLMFSSEMSCHSTGRMELHGKKKKSVLILYSNIFKRIRSRGWKQRSVYVDRLQINSIH